MTYMVRDENGILLLRVEDRFVQGLIEANSGFFRPYRIEGKRDITVYELTQCMTFDAGFGKIFLWEKTVCVPGKD